MKNNHCALLVYGRPSDRETAQIILRKAASATLASGAGAAMPEGVPGAYRHQNAGQQRQGNLCMRPLRRRNGAFWLARYSHSLIVLSLLTVLSAFTTTNASPVAGKVESVRRDGTIVITNTVSVRVPETLWGWVNVNEGGRWVLNRRFGWRFYRNPPILRWQARGIGYRNAHAVKRTTIKNYSGWTKARPGELIIIKDKK
jgi:hypothetical protein